MEVDEVNATTPTLLERMEVNNEERRTLLDRLETPGDTPPNFVKMRRGEPALLYRLTTRMEANPIMSPRTNRLTSSKHQENHKGVAGRDCVAECGRSDGSGATPP